MTKNKDQSNQNTLNFRDKLLISSSIHRNISIKNYMIFYNFLTLTNFHPNFFDYFCVFAVCEPHTPLRWPAYKPLKFLWNTRLGRNLAPSFSGRHRCRGVCQTHLPAHRRVKEQGRRWWQGQGVRCIL